MENKRRHGNVVNVSEVEPRELAQGERFRATMKGLGRSTGAKGIGCTWYEIPPGKTAFPRHYHCANEEAIFVLEGEGRLRIGADEVRVGPGDYVTFPVGPDAAHGLVNSGTGPLRYLCFSTLQYPEVVGYPDSKKVGTLAGSWEKPWIRAIFKEGSGVDYYEGEDKGWE